MLAHDLCACCAYFTAQLQARQAILEEELDKTRRKEGTLSVEVNKGDRGRQRGLAIQFNALSFEIHLSPQLSSLCQQVLQLALGESQSSETASPAAAIAAISSLVEQHAQSQGQIESLAGQLEEVIHCSLGGVLYLC